MVSLLAGVALGALVPTTTASGTTPYQPPELTNPAVQQATLSVAAKYANIEPGLDAQTLRWFLYAVEHRESTFNAGACNYNDGAQWWNSPPSMSWFWPTSDHVPHGCGLMQLTGWGHEGMPYPNNAQSDPSWLNKGVYGWVHAPVPLTALSNPFDPQQNLARFVTEHVLPDYGAIRAVYPWMTPTQILRVVAFQWNKGDWVPYDGNNCDYLCLYDSYVAEYKPAVLNDWAWNPSGSTSGSGSASGSSAGSVSFSLGSVNNWWIEVYATPSSGSVTSVTATVNGQSVPLTHMWWGGWATVHYTPAGAAVTFQASTSTGGSGQAGPYIWP
ncbi:MAG: hypothetical protein ACYDDF_13885 [Thermoplasmatota archaeon]